MKRFLFISQVSQLSITKALLLTLKVVILGVMLFSGLSTHAQHCGSSAEVLAKWNFNSETIQCNGAQNLGPTPITNPSITPGATYCPNINNSCGTATLGSIGHQNTPQYLYGVCLANFYNVEAVLATGMGAPYNPSATTFDPEGKANLSVWYNLPKNTSGCLTSFALTVLQKQFNGSRLNFRANGVAVKRNGVIIYSNTQNLVATNINGTPLTYTFPTSADFCSDGSEQVEFEIIFGLVERLIPPAMPGTPGQTGYDDICVNGYCKTIAFGGVIPATCDATTGPNNDAKVLIQNFEIGNKYAYNEGDTYTGSATYTSGSTVIPNDGLVTNFPNPSVPTKYTFRVFQANCFSDFTVTIEPKVCCILPTGITLTPTDATCTSGTANNDAKIQVNVTTGGTKVGISTGNTYTGPGYATAQTLTTGSYTFTGLSNPAVQQTYTIRIFKDAGCYIDMQTTIRNKDCFVPCAPPSGATLTATQATCTGITLNPNASITVSNVSGGDKVGYSSSISYSGPKYATASSLSGGSFTFSGIAMPNGGQIFTVRIFNTSDGCYIDKTIEIAETKCDSCVHPSGYVVGTGLAVNETNGANNQGSTESCKNDGYVDLELTKSVSPTAGITCGSNGAPIVWTLTLKNAGTMTATGVNVVDLLPAGLSYVSSSASKGSYFGGSGWNVGSLAANETVTLQLTTKALLTGTYANCAYVNSAEPKNDPDSSPSNTDSANEDDYACATVIVTGNNSPTITKSFSPMLTKPGVPTRLTISITNNSTSPITLTSDLVDTFPTTAMTPSGPLPTDPPVSTPAPMVIAPAPILTTAGLTLPSGGSITANAGSGSLTIPSGTILRPGLNEVSIDITVPLKGDYCNSIPAGALKTSGGDNCLATDACIKANPDFVMAPIVKKTMSPETIPVNGTSTLTILIENKNATAMTLNQDFVDNFPSSLVANGAVSSSCGGVTLKNSGTQLVMDAGTVIAANSICTITATVTSSTNGTYCNKLLMNSVLTTVGTNNNNGNEDVPEACLVVGSCVTPIAPTSLAASPTTICAGASSTLSATCASGTLTWYSDATLTTTITSPVSPTVTTTYYAACVNGTCKSPSSNITVTVNLGIAPLLSTVSPVCNGATYSVTFVSNGTVTASAGTVSGNMITGIPVGTNVILTATSTNGCVTSVSTVMSPTSCANPLTGCVVPTLSAGQGVCSGSGTYSVAFQASAGATITASAGTVSGNTITGIPIASNVTITATSGTCTTSIIVTKPIDCTTPCASPGASFAVAVCSGGTYSVSISNPGNATITASTGTVTATAITGITIGTSVTITASAVGCTPQTVTLNSPTGIAPLLSTVSPVCNGATYSVTFVSNGTVTASAGTVSGNMVTGIPVATNVILTATSTNGCATSVSTVMSPTSCTNPPTGCVVPTLSAGQGVCSGTGTYSVAFQASAGATITASAGTVSGNTITGIPIASNVTITATSGTCTTSIIVTKPIDCTTPCASPGASFAVAACSEGTYNVSISNPGNATITSSTGTVTATAITGITIGTSVTITASAAGCTPQTVTLNSPICEEPSISIVKGSSFSAGADNIINAGDIITYSYDVTNTGTVLLTGVTVTESVASFTGTGTLPTPTFVSATQSSPEGSLKVGEKAIYTATYAVTAADIAAGKVDNLAFANGLSPNNVAVKDTSDSKNPSDYNETGTPGTNPKEKDKTGTTLCNLTSPTNATASPTTICTGASSTLSANCASGTLTWYSDAVLTASLPSNTVSPTTTTTYFAACVNGTCKSPSAQVTITVTSTPLAPTSATASPTTICTGASSTLSANCASGTLTWYSDAVLTASLPSNTVSPTTTTTYFAACVNGTCKSTSAQVTVTVTPTPLAPTSATASPTTICTGASSNLSANCASGTLTWYSDAVLTASLPSNTVSPTTTTTYFAACVNGTCKSPSAQVTITVTPTPLAPTSATASPTTICTGASSTLSANCASGTLTWYSDAVLTASLPSNTVSPTTTTTYFAACVNGTCKSTSAQVTVTVTPTPLAPTSATASPTTICTGASSNLSANCASGTLTWYSDAVLTASLPSNTVSPTTTTTYFAACVNGTCKSPSAQVTITVTPTPLAPTSATASPTTICTGASSNLSANCASGTLTWYSDAVLTASLPSNTVSPTTTTTYFASCVNGTCKSPSAQVTVTVTPTPLSPTSATASPTTICTGASSNLSANCASGTLTWYSDAVLTASLPSNTVSPTTTTTYFASCVNGTCKSPSAQVTVTVTPTPLAPTSATASPTTICTGASSNLSANCASGTLTWYSDAGLTASLSSNTVSPTTTTTYFAACVNGTCKSPSAQVTVTVDACLKGSLGDYVWKDTNNNGQQDAGEVGVAGVTVELYRNGVLSTSVITDGNGKYMFPNLDAATYYIKIVTSTIPVGCQISSKPNVGIDDAKDSDIDPITGISGNYVIDPTDPNRTNITSVDAGLSSPLGSLGNYVWKDTDNDGIQDIGEAGVGGVKIELYKGTVLVGSDITDANGAYLFSNLDAGNYSIKVITSTIPAGCQLSTVQDSGSDDSKDSDVNPISGVSGTYVIDPTDPTKKDITTVDAALFAPKGSLGDLVWKDTDNDGQQDAGEIGVAGVTVELYKSGVLSATSTTDANGKYLFTGLDAGTYSIKIISSSLPAGCVISTLQNAGTDDAIDSDVNPTTGVSGNYIIDPANPALKDILTVDAALFSPKGSLGDLVWKDANNNGLQESTETGVAGVTVELYKNGILSTSKVTDATGKYLFTNLDAGAYSIKIIKSTLPAGCLLSELPNTGTDDAKDSDIDPTTGTSGVYNLDPSNPLTKDFTNVDAGLYSPKGSLGDYVWKDTDNDGIQDVGESGVAGIQIELYKGSALAATTTTDATGRYLFTNLDAGNYSIKVTSASLPVGCQLSTKPNTGTDDTKDSDINPSTGTSGNYVIDPLDPTKKDILTVDAALYSPKGSIGDWVWKDTNNNGVQDAGEAGVPVVTVQLYKSGVLSSTTTTDATGKYTFANLDAGTYTVKIVTSSLPIGCQLSDKPNTGNDESKDSDFDPTTGSTNPIIVDPTDPSKTTFTNVDAGLKTTLLGSIGDYVWKDANDNGKQDIGEAGVKDVKMILRNAQGIELRNTLTDANGYYRFDNLEKGEYIVKIDITTFPEFCRLSDKPNVDSDDSKDSDFNSTGNSPIIVIDPEKGGLDKDNPTIDAGLVVIPHLGIFDPCVCFRVEYFLSERKELFEELVLNASSGQTWTVVEQTGMLDLDSTVLGRPKIPLAVGKRLEERTPGKYYLKFTIEDNIPYTIKLTNGKDVINYGNTCTGKYPEVNLTVLSKEVCINAAPIPLEATSNPSGPLEFFYEDKVTGQRVVITEFDPSKFSVNDTIFVKLEAKPLDSNQCTSIIIQPVVISTKDCEAPSLSLVKGSSLNLGLDGVASVGDIITYSYDVTNTGNVLLSNISVVESASSFSGTGTMPSPTFGSSTLASPAGTLKVGEKATYSASYAITAADILAGKIDNSAFANGISPKGTAVKDTSDSKNPADYNESGMPSDPDGEDKTGTPIGGQTDIAVIKKVSNNLPSKGDQITYTITAKNLGPVLATNVIVSDQLPVGVSLVSATPNKGTWTSPKWTIPVLAAGDSAKLTFVVNVTGEGVMNNIAKLDTLDQKDSNPDNNQSKVCISVPISICQGNTMELSAPQGYTNVIWYKDGIQVGSGNTYIASATGSYTMSADQGGTCSTGSCCPVRIMADICETPKIAIAKGSSLNLGTDGMATVGDIITYAYDVTNIGNVVLNSVNITENIAAFTGTGILPAPTFVSSTMASPAGTLKVGEKATYSATYAITAADIFAGKIDNSAFANGISPKGIAVKDTSDSKNPADYNESGIPSDPNGEDKTGTQIAESPKIAIVKGSALNLGTDGVATPGDIVTYSYDVTNIGNVTLTSVTVTDNAAGFTGTGTLPSPTFVSSTLASPVGILKVGEKATYSATYAITAADILAGKIDNSAFANGISPKGTAVKDTSDSKNPADYNESGVPSDPNGEDKTGTPIAESPKIAIFKGSALNLGTDGVATPGDIVTYSYDVTNIGNVTLTSVTVTENAAGFTGTGTLPSPTFVSSTLASPVGILKVGEKATYSATYAITAADILAGKIDNSAFANGLSPKNVVVRDTSDSKNSNDYNETGMPSDPSGEDKTGTPIADNICKPVCVPISVNKIRK